MADDFENIVRPFQSPPSIGSDRITLPASQRALQPIVTMAWGTAGNVPAAQKMEIDLSFPGNKDRYKEKSRTTETVRVKNPDDPSQFVDVARIKKISFAAKNTDAPTSATTIAPSGSTPGGQGPVDGVTQAEVTSTAGGLGNNPGGVPTKDSDYELTPPPGDPAPVS